MKNKKENIMLVGGEPGQLMIIIRNLMLEERKFLLYCFDTKYKNNKGHVEILSKCKISLKTAMDFKRLQRVKKYLKYKATRYIKINKVEK